MMFRAKIHKNSFYFNLHDLLNPGNMNIKEWIQNGGVPDLCTYVESKNENYLYQNDFVKFYYKGTDVVCKIIFHEGMFCLQWPDKYINQFRLHEKKYEIIDEPIQKNKNK